MTQTFYVAGCQFAKPPYKYLAEGQRVDLVPETTNQYDPNAIRCNGHGGAKLGYVPRTPTSQLSGCRFATILSLEPRNRGYEIQLQAVLSDGGAVEQNNKENQMQDPLSINIQLQGVDTRIPLLPEQDYQVQCVESIVAPNKDKEGLNWELKFALTSSATAVDGRPVAPNFPLFTVVGLQPGKDSKDNEAFIRNISSTVDALFGTTIENRPAFNKELVDAAVGKSCIASTYINEWPEGSGNKNNKIRKLKPLAA